VAAIDAATLTPGVVPQTAARRQEVEEKGKMKHIPLLFLIAFT
jgi:hypothetical protein